MKRILDENAIAKAKTKWKYYVPQIIKQAKMEKGVHVEKNPEIHIVREINKIYTVVFTKCALCMCISYREQPCHSDISITILDS